MSGAFRATRRSRGRGRGEGWCGERSCHFSQGKMQYRLRLYSSVLGVLILLWHLFLLLGFFFRVCYFWQGLKGASAFSNCVSCEIYVVLLGKATLWRAGLGRWRGVGGELRSLSDSEGSVSVCGEPVSPTSSRRNLNLDRKSCHTTYQPANQQQISPTPSRCT